MAKQIGTIQHTLQAQAAHAVNLALTARNWLIGYYIVEFEQNGEDRAALRERLANYTPEDELEQDKRELDGLLQEINYQLIEFRNLLKEINALKEELHGIHGSLKHTVQRERTAFNALLAAKDSADNIVDGINRAIVKAEQHTVIRAKIGTDELAKVHQCTAQHIKAEEELLEKHSNKMAKRLQM